MRGHQQQLSSPTAVLGHVTPALCDLYDVGRKLGQGQFGTTYLCTELSTGAAFACKSIAKRKLLTPEDVDDMRREIQIMHHLAGHKSVVTIKGAYEDALYVHIVMELCEGGELFDCIVDRGYFSERKATEIARVIVGVVEACHSLGVMHRDLKLENFLLKDKASASAWKAPDEHVITRPLAAHDGPTTVNRAISSAATTCYGKAAHKHDTDSPPWPPLSEIPGHGLLGL